MKVAQLPGIERVAATSGLIISVAAVCATISASLAGRLGLRWSLGWLLLVGCLAGGIPCALMAWSDGWLSLLLLRCASALCLGGSLTLAYSLGGQIVPSASRGSAFGWLALSVQVGTAVSPLATGALAAVSLPGAFLFDGVLAWVAGGLLFFGARGLLARRD